MIGLHKEHNDFPAFVSAFCLWHHNSLCCTTFIHFVLDAKKLTMIVPSTPIYSLRPPRSFSLLTIHSHNHTHTQSFKTTGQPQHSKSSNREVFSLSEQPSLRTAISTIKMSSRRSSNLSRSSARDSVSDMSRGMSEMRVSSRDSGSRSRDSYSRDSGSRDSYSHSRDSYSRDSCSRDSCSRDSCSRDSGSRYPTDDDTTSYTAYFCPHCHPEAAGMNGVSFSGPPPRGIEGFLRRNGGGGDSHSRDRTSSRTSSSRTSHGSSTRRLENGPSSTSRRDSSYSSSSRRDSSGRPSSRPSAAGGELTLYNSGERSSASRHPSMDERSSARYSDDRSSTRRSTRDSSRRH